MESRIIFSEPGNRRLILIFAGWSTNPSFYRHLRADGWDIGLVWDYYSLEFEPDIIRGYESIYLIAWSMGVAAAAHTAATSLPADKISAAFAVNGTLFPCSDVYGIPEDVYEGTRLNMNPRNLLKFTKRMGYVPPKNLPPALKEDFYVPDFERLASELENVKKNSLKGTLPWKRVYISLNDRIFPASNMERAWESVSPMPEIVRLNAQHYIDLQLIIDNVTPDINLIGGHFADAMATYDANAKAQSEITAHLFSMIDEINYPEIHDMLEVGPGSGLLTSKLLTALPLHSATFVDLYPLKPFGLIQNETYIEADAEKWISDAPDRTFDLVASASTIQWFADPDSFFRHSYRILREEGFLLCSTFLPGNLGELSSGRPAPLIYRSAEELEKSLRKYFPEVSMHPAPIHIRFGSRREMLLHLKLTGVAGAKRSRLPIALSDRQSSGREENPGTHTLTYHPLYILAKKY